MADSSEQNKGDKDILLSINTNKEAVVLQDKGHKMFSHKAIKPCLFGSVLVFLIFLGIAGCSEPAPPPAPPPEPVTITFGYTGFENRTAIREYYQEMADQFNQKYPHITVEVGFDELSSVFFRGRN